jgi:hypothetical protein
MTLTDKEKNDVLLGNVSEKHTDTYKKAKVWYDERIKVYSDIGKLSASATRFWFDSDESAIKMQFGFESIDFKKYEALSKDFDKVFGKMNQDLDALFSEMNTHMSKVFENVAPAMGTIFSGFDEIFGDFFGKETKKKK